MIRRKIEGVQQEIKNSEGKQRFRIFESYYQRRELIAALNPETASVTDLIHLEVEHWDLTFRCGKCQLNDLTEAVCVGEYVDDYGSHYNYLCLKCFHNLHSEVLNKTGKKES